MVVAARTGNGWTLGGGLAGRSVVAACADRGAISAGQTCPAGQDGARSLLRRALRVRGAACVTHAALLGPRTVRRARALAARETAYSRSAHRAQIAGAAFACAKVASRRNPVHRTGRGIRQVADLADGVAGLRLDVVAGFSDDVLARRVDDAVASLRGVVAGLRTDVGAGLWLLALAGLRLRAAADLTGNVVANLALLPVAGLRRDAGAGLRRAAAAGVGHDTLAGLRRGTRRRVAAGLGLQCT